MRKGRALAGIALIIAVTLTLAIPSITSGEQSRVPSTPLRTKCYGSFHQFTVDEFKPLARRIYRHKGWRRDDPLTNKKRFLMKRMKKCAQNPLSRKRMRHLQARSARAWYRWKIAEEETYENTPEVGPGGTHWAIPWYIVSCESGGDYGAINTSSGARGAYQMMPSTYGEYCVRCDWSKADQDRAARALYEAKGSGPWSCA